MATWAIGDVQGCFLTLRKLLAAIGWPRTGDRLVLVGDLVNRGPRSRDVLRWAADAGDRVEAVLGNHDLHLLGRAAGVAKRAGGDTLDQLLDAEDREELLDWLRARPFLVRAPGSVVVHAGLLPSWTLDEAERLARAASAALDGPAHARTLAAIRKKGPPSTPEGAARVLTRLRFCGPGGETRWGFSGAPPEAPEGSVPWFDAPRRRGRGTRVVFGHWAALGLHLRDDVAGLDAGCVWGGALAALRLEDSRLVLEPLADGPPVPRDE